MDLCLLRTSFGAKTLIKSTKIMKNRSYAVSILCLLCSSLGYATQIEGTVRLANGQPARNAVLWLEGSEHGKPLKHALIDQKDLTFIPHISVITVGTNVSFPNSDTVYHNVFAEFEAKKFDFGMYPKGTFKTKTFDKPGIVALLCSVHSSMSAYIMVVDTPYYCITDRNGHFKMSDVRDGNYQLRAWHESNQTYKGTLAVAGNTGPVAIQTARI
jgi:plastocyanin